ncbi:MAG: DNA internalization-related competence protein ComEC/Rec2, partial [Spongiibacteraceae bacterium]
ICAFLLAGIYASDSAHRHLDTLLPAEREGQDVALQFTVSSPPEKTSGNRVFFRFDAKVTGRVCGSEICASPLGKIRLNWYTDKPPALGSEMTAVLRLKRPRGYASPGAFDYGRWLIVHGYSATGYVRELLDIDRDSGALLNLRDRIVARYSTLLQNYSQAGLMKALLFAERSDVSQESWQLFRQTGTSHLMAISGMHIAIVLGWGLILGRLFMLATRGRVTAQVAGLLIGGLMAVAYAALAGFSLPTQRALIMALVAVLFVLLRREISPWLGIQAALLAVLIADPLAAHNAGFFLSFGAVAVLLLGFQGRRQPLTLGRGLWRAQLIITAGLLPVLAMWQLNLSLATIPANIFAIPLLTILVLPLLFVALLVSLLSENLSQPCWQLVDYLLSQLLQVLELLSRYFPTLALENSPLVLALAVLAVLLVLLPRGLPGRWLACVLILPLFFSRVDTVLDRGEMRLVVFDVGQGLSVLLQTQNSNTLYDVGPRFDSGFNTADAVLLPFLRRQGIERIDHLVISHADNDHAGSTAALLLAIPVTNIIVGEAIEGVARFSASCHGHPPWQQDGVIYRFLDDSSQRPSSGNNASCVLHIGNENRSVLLSGDIEASREGELLRRFGKQLAATVLVAPHHGSNTSSTVDFVNAVSPQLVIFSAGYKHHYGHPIDAVLSRYQGIGSRCLNTANQGSIVIDVAASGDLRVQSWRPRGYYWEQAATELCVNTHSY